MRISQCGSRTDVSLRQALHGQEPNLCTVAEWETSYWAQPCTEQRPTAAERILVRRIADQPCWACSACP